MMLPILLYFLIFLEALPFPISGNLSSTQSLSLEVPKIDSRSSQHHHLRRTDFRAPPEQVSLEELLANSQAYHQHIVSIQGLITQPELHLNETKLFLDFVFRLSQGNHSIVVYGQHDRTRSAPPISLNLSVEVIGIFWKEQDRKGSTIMNAIEAISVTPYPSSIPEST